ncbi:MAG: sarcosine oxidase subunit gamma [Acidiferrobacterales bacterium]
MAEKYLRQSPLAHLHLEARAVSDPGDAGVALCERPSRGQLALRGETQDKAFTSAVEQVLSVGLPTEANTATTKGDTSVLWLGSNEWLVVMPDGREEETADVLGRVLADCHFAVSNVSDSRVIIGLAGRHARDVLLKGCSLDLHPRSFVPGQCAQSSLARCHMLLHQIDQTPTYDVYVHRSFADYVWRWLEDAAQEYRLAIVAEVSTEAAPKAPPERSRVAKGSSPARSSAKKRKKPSQPSQKKGEGAAV